MVIAAALIALATAATDPARNANLSLLLESQTEAFSKAGRTGDRATLDRLLAPDVVFTTETGATPSRSELIDGAAPASGNADLRVTDFKLQPQGDVATATFVDVLNEDFHGISIRTDYRSSEVWARRGKNWRLIASHTTIVPHELKTVSLPADELDQYVGTYQLGGDLRTTIVRDGKQLFASTNGGERRPLGIEYRDVLFVVGMPASRRYVQRDAAGRVVGYVLNVNGNDLLVRRIDAASHG